MTTYADFFEGSATVAGALIGLLFVALSLAPERLRDNRSIEHQAIAATAFTALVDALFVSLVALQPGSGVDYALVIFGALGLSSTTGLTFRLWRARHRVRLSNRWPIFIGIIICTYAAQLASGLIHDSTAGYYDRAATFVYVMFGVGIARAWQLLGLKAGGILDELGLVVSIHPYLDETPPDDPAEKPAEK
ncbi:MAG: hypothetical protein ACLPQY_14655 [Streptosporangiaceae bacterium]